MRDFTQTDREHLLAILRVGKRNAINAPNIARQLNARQQLVHFSTGGNQVKTRDLIRECIELEGDLIASTLSNPKGFYIVDENNPPELQAYLDSLASRITGITNRRDALINSWNQRHPDIPVR